MFEDLNDSQRSARQYRLLRIYRWIQEPNVLVHVADKLRRQSFYILEQADCPLKSPISIVVEDRIVDYDTVDAVILVRTADFVF